MSSRQQEVVLCLHGLGNSKYLMSPISIYLTLKGYKVYNIDYPSTKADIDNLNELIADEVFNKFKLNKNHKVHLLGFSLGSQIFIKFIEKYSEKLDIKNLVMLGPPNQGSELARMLKKVLPTKRIWGPVFDQLCAVKNTALTTSTEIGIIAGGTGLSVGFLPVLKGDNDGIVKLSETEFSACKQKIVVFCIHAFLPLYPKVWRCTYNFFRTGILSKTG